MRSKKELYNYIKFIYKAHVEMTRSCRSAIHNTETKTPDIKYSFNVRIKSSSGVVHFTW